MVREVEKLGPCGPGPELLVGQLILDSANVSIDPMDAGFCSTSAEFPATLQPTSPAFAYPPVGSVQTSPGFPGPHGRSTVCLRSSVTLRSPDSI